MQTKTPLINDKTAYLDNAATTQKPQRVLDTLTDFYTENNANPHRSMYDLANEATQEVEQARSTYADALNAADHEIFFTKNATESLNHLAHGFKNHLDETDEILTTTIEHHSNLLPWQTIADETGATLTILPHTEAHNIAKHADENTAIVTFTHMSNVTGETFDVAQITDDIKRRTNAKVIVDGCQAYPHQALDVDDLNVDAYAFSAHKHYGPTGVGITYLDDTHHNTYDPVLKGGGMVDSVNHDSHAQSTPPHGFEAGTLNAAGIVASGEATAFLEANRETINQHESKLQAYTQERLDKADIDYYGHDRPSGPVFSLKTNQDAYDIAHILNDYDVCIRAGNHCADPLMDDLNTPSTPRISLAYYNTTDDIDQTIHALQQARDLLGGTL